MGMKRGIGYNRLRCKRLSLTLTALICTTILLRQWEETPLFTVLSPQNQLENLSPVVVDGVQTLDHEADNEENVKIKAVEKETKAEQGKRNIEEHLNEPNVETRNDEAKNFGAVPMGFETARSPEKRNDGLTPPSVEKGGKDNPEVEDVESDYGLLKAAGAKQSNGWAYRFPTTNTTILYFWSASLCNLEPLNITEPATDYAMHLDHTPAFLQCYLHRFNVLVLNKGHHWNRGKLNANWWVMYVGGEPLRDRKLAHIGNAKNYAVYSVMKWLDSQLPHHPQLKAFFRTM